jgi:hypothetical protein
MTTTYWKYPLLVFVAFRAELKLLPLSCHTGMVNERERVRETESNEHLSVISILPEGVKLPMAFGRSRTFRIGIGGVTHEKPELQVN